MAKTNQRARRLDANELLLISVRINDLRSLKSRLVNDIYLVKTLCGVHYYSSSLNAVSNMNMLVSEVEMEKKRLTKRTETIITRLIKKSGKWFEESPSKIVPLHSRDILNGYIELNEVNHDQPVPHLLLLESGNIEPTGSVRAKEVMTRGPSYENEFTNRKISAHTILAKAWPG